jgi:natural product biosynthesis luciferase-like monooxygenase protein
MKFGLNFFPSFRPSDTTTVEYYDQCLRLAERADARGFSSVKAVEHQFFDYGGHSPSPIVFLAAVAARTRRIRPITGAVIPAFNHPVKSAAELAMLDNLSRGRLDVGFGRAFIPKEFEVFGVSLDESRPRFEECIDVITRLWTEDRVTYQGRFFKLEDVHLMPRPVQRPHPPIWIAAIASADSFAWAARHGYHLMIVPHGQRMDRTREFVETYRKTWKESGFKPGAEQVQVALFAYLAETHDEAVRGFDAPARRYIELLSEAVGGWSTARSAQYPGYDQLMQAITALTPEKLVENRLAYVGTPAEAIEQVRWHRDFFGEIEPSMQINFGGIGDRDAFRTLELLADGVMPGFARA